MRHEKLDEQVLSQLGLPITPAPDLGAWEVFLKQYRHPQQTLRIGLIGKYTTVPDAYHIREPSDAKTSGREDARVS